MDANVMAARDVVADTVYDETVLADDFSKVIGLKLSRAVEQGRPLRRSDLDIKAKEFAETLPEGMRAITIDVDEINSVAQMVRVGNRVDLMLIVSESGEGGGQQVISLLQRVKIIATGQNATRAQADAPAAAQGTVAQRYSNVTLEVTPEEAARIALAQQMGRIRAVLRNEEDQLVAPLAKVNTQSLMRGYAGDKKGEESPFVEFIIGGKGSGGVGQTVNVNMPPMLGAPPPTGAPQAPVAAPPGQISIPGVGTYPLPYGPPPAAPAPKP
ncbi:MAG: Flp pilus assembly protein CpaB [Betaproteobacteria bacterium]|nr:Flp pilus assembly protein CpaB [Betaproteobacteria bacterium]